MNTRNVLRKSLVGGLTVAMLAGGTTSAFAADKGNGPNKNKWKNKGNDDGLTLQIKLNFDDIRGSDVEWALRHIASLASKQVFDGYEDGTFQPRKVITRIEAITAAVRLMGLKDEAEDRMDTELNFKDADKIESKYPWAVGYVAVAVENDLFLETDTSVQPDKEADRLWATMLLVKALKLEDEAKQMMNTKLDFKDADQIPAGAVGYVAVAVDRNLIDGYENNTFRPNKPVTRAELAALLDRTGEQLPDNDEYFNRGEITSISGDTITIRYNGDTESYRLHANAIIFRDDEVADVSELEIGDEVRINFYDNRIIFLEVTEEADDDDDNNDNDDNDNDDNDDNDNDNDRDDDDDYTVRGKFHSMTLNSRGQIATISVTQSVYSGSDVHVYRVDDDVDIDGNPANLVAGRDVTLKVEDNVVEEIDIHS